MRHSASMSFYWIRIQAYFQSFGESCLSLASFCCPPPPPPMFLYDDFGARDMYLGHAWVITSHLTANCEMWLLMHAWILLTTKSYYYHTRGARLKHELSNLNTTTEWLLRLEIVIIASMGKRNTDYQSPNQCYFGGKKIKLNSRSNEIKNNESILHNHVGFFGSLYKIYMPSPIKNKRYLSQVRIVLWE